MKFITIILIVMGSFDLFAVTAKISRLKKESAPPVVHKKVKGKRSDDVLQKIFEQGKKIDQLLKGRSSAPIIWEQSATILTGKVIRGTLLNSINSTNIASPILVRAHEGQGLAPSTKFSCQGVTAHERVFVLCNKMIDLKKERVISAQVLNMDGTSGLVGDFQDGKEEMITGAIVSNFAGGVLSVAQTRVATPYGAINENSAKNQILQGLIESGKTTSDILTEDMKTKEPIVTVNAGTEVLVYFMEAVHES